MAANTALRDVLERTGITRGELARLVQSRARVLGHHHIAPDATAVRRWLGGQRLRHPLPDVLADVFSAQLGCRITTCDLGLGESPVDRALVYHASYADTVEAVSDLGRADVDRRSFLTSAAFTAAATVAPGRDWLLATLDQPSPSPNHRVGLGDVAAVKQMFTKFQRLDIFQGGGAGRALLARYTSEHVYPLLRHSQDGRVHQALCEAASEQTYLLGWMAYDCGEQGTAQRYLIQALRLAEESNNAALGAHLLARMADQAIRLGNPAEGRRLAQAGRHGLTRAHSPACLADLWTLEARAYALLGDKRTAAHAVVQSEAAFERVRPSAEPSWASFTDVAYLHGEHANTFRDTGDWRAAEEHARLSIEDARAQNRARRGAMSHAVLAVTHLQHGDLESTHAAGLRTVNLTRQVKSSRCIEAVQDLQQRMRPYGNHRLVADFNEHARDIVTAA